MTRRGMLLGLALLVTLVAVYFAPTEEATVVQAAARAPVPDAPPREASAPTTARATASAARVIELRPRDDVDGDDSRLFAAQSWDPPPAKAEAPAQVPVAPAAPQAPPVPLQLLGRYQEDGRTAMFATFNGDSIVLWPGENINPEWRVDAIEPGQVVLTYLPLGQKQGLPWTATQ
ncbi:hypothetical protein [Variovorax paradoxus]|uniref:hypothetical protein n=1 Tax=Variovorax paradoxus TaxID=34073 RepID=UPI003D65E542